MNSYITPILCTVFLLFSGVSLFMPSTSQAQTIEEKSASYREKPVQFQHGETSLAGVLCLPTTGQGPFPVVVFVMGSGATTRDGYSTLPPLWEEFAQRGFASLAWDKPGVGESTGNWRTQTTKDRAQEGLAAIGFLKGRKEVDPKRIGLWGISQAGWVMPLMVSMSADIAFMISVSGPVGTGAEQEVYRVEHQLPADGRSAKETARALAFTKLRFDLMRLNAPYETYARAQTLVEDEGWLEELGKFSAVEYDFIKSRTDFSARTYLEKVTCPVLAIFGQRDTIVNTAASIEGYPSALKKAGNQDVSVKVFPNADHCIFLTKTGGLQEMIQSFQKPDKPFADGYLSTMGDWLQERFQ